MFGTNLTRNTESRDRKAETLAAVNLQPCPWHFGWYPQPIGDRPNVRQHKN